DGDDHRAAAQAPAHVAPHHAAHDLLQLVRVPTIRLIRHGLLEGRDDLGADLLEHLGILRDAAGMDLGPGDERPGLGVDHGEQRDEALVPQDPTILEIRLGDFAHARAVDVHVAVGHLAHRPGDPVLQVDDVAVLRQHHALFRHTGALGD